MRQKDSANIGLGVRLLAVFLLAAALVAGGQFQAGLARVEITPESPIRLSGYASRDHASEGVLHKLWAKALALEDAEGNRVVIVTADIIGLHRVLSDEIAARMAKEYGLDRAQLLLNCSHTHTGPVIWPNLLTMYSLSDEEQDTLRRYSRRLAGEIVAVVGAALGDLSECRLDHGGGSAGFAANRREITPEGKVKFGVQPDGAVDHSVPVIRVTGADGALRAVLFGYACHNTTLTGEHYKISGDYAGFAQMELEKQHPGATAMFLALCGADQNPNPRQKLEHAIAHGNALAREVERVLGAKLEPVSPRLRSAFQMADLTLAPHSRKQFEAELSHEHHAYRNRAKAMLEAYDKRLPVRQVPFPVQAIRFGEQVSLVALGGEVVVDYALRIKKEYPSENLIVAGYSNDVMCYIPSVRILREGGYEAEASMVYYGQPGPFTEEVENTVIETVEKILARVGVPPQDK